MPMENLATHNRTVTKHKDDTEEEFHEKELRYGDFLRASPHKQALVKVEKRGNNRDELRKYLFAGKQEEVAREEE